jgi:hypothetical protein
VPALWGGLHAALIAALREQLAPLVRPRFFVDSEDQVYLLLPDDLELGPVKSDMALVEVGTGPVGARGGAGRIVALVHVALPQPVPVRYARLVLRDVATSAVVAVIDVRSPVNKRPGHPGQRRFERKRARLLQADLHWIEIDLLRGGERPPELAGRAPYLAALHRAGGAVLDLWPIGLRERLPTIAVPLVEPLPDVPLDLATALTAVYDRYGYDLVVDDRADPPPPPFTPDDLAWIRARSAVPP